MVTRVLCLSLIVEISIILRAATFLIRLLLVVRVVAHIPEVFIVLVELLLHLSRSNQSL